MKQTVKNKVLALLFVLAVLTPLLVQASHVFERHEHVICTAKDVKHFHADELDCNICQTTIENLYTGINSEFSFLELYNNYKNQQIAQFEITNGPLQLKSTRAPPYFIV